MTDEPNDDMTDEELEERRLVERNLTDAHRKLALVIEVNPVRDGDTTKAGRPVVPVLPDAVREELEPGGAPIAPIIRREVFAQTPEEAIEFAGWSGGDLGSLSASDVFPLSDPGSGRGVLP